MDITKRSKIVEEISHKIREVIIEFGKESLVNAVFVGEHDLGTALIGFEYIRVPTLSGVWLGRVDYKVARFFEDL